MDSIYYAIQIAFYKILFLNTTSLGGWTEDKVMVFVATYLVVDAIQMTLFSNNIWWIPILINKGDLDYYLVRPVSSFFFVSTRDFAANSFINFLISIGICTWALVHYQGTLSLLNLALYVVCIFLGALIHFALHFIFILPVFWTHSGKGLFQVFWPLTKFMERPDPVFKGWIRYVLLTILPFSLMASVPARILWENPFQLTLWVLVGAIFSLWFARSLWYIGLRNYSSASS